MPTTSLSVSVTEANSVSTLHLRLIDLSGTANSIYPLAASYYDSFSFKLDGVTMTLASDAIYNALTYPQMVDAIWAALGALPAPVNVSVSLGSNFQAYTFDGQLVTGQEIVLTTNDGFFETGDYGWGSSGGLPSTNSMSATISTDYSFSEGLFRNQHFTGTSADETIFGSTGDDLINGGAGIDTAAFSSQRANYTVVGEFFGYTVKDNQFPGREGTDTLVAVERLQFSDTNLALDLDGHAGQAAKLLGAVFGPAAVANQDFVGFALTLLDNGWSYEQTAAQVLGLTGKTSHTDVAALLWTNLIGFAPTAAQAAPIVSLLDNGMSIGLLTTLAADLSINTNNINLVGLSQTGIEFY